MSLWGGSFGYRYRLRRDLMELGSRMDPAGLSRVLVFWDAW